MKGISGYMPYYLLTANSCHVTWYSRRRGTELIDNSNRFRKLGVTSLIRELHYQRLVFQSFHVFSWPCRDARKEEGVLTI